MTEEQMRLVLEAHTVTISTMLETLTNVVLTLGALSRRIEALEKAK